MRLVRAWGVSFSATLSSAAYAAVTATEPEVVTMPEPDSLAVILVHLLAIGLLVFVVRHRRNRGKA
jgi:hypothetical protein